MTVTGTWTNRLETNKKGFHSSAPQLAVQTLLSYPRPRPIQQSVKVKSTLLRKTTPKPYKTRCKINKYNCLLKCETKGHIPVEHCTDQVLQNLSMGSSITILKDALAQSTPIPVKHWSSIKKPTNWLLDYYSEGRTSPEYTN